MKRVAFHNLGCKVNAYETEAMQEMVARAGYEIVPFAEGADVYVVNTCTVTNIADRKSRQMLHRARKMNPHAVVVATGCYVQAREENEIDPCIDIVIGNNHKKDLLRILESHQKELLVEKEEIGMTREYESLGLTKTGGHTRAYVKVQDGCNQFCTYCIIPYARGRVRSRPLSDVVSEVEALAGNGYREVVLTGIHLSSYGIDFDGERHLLSLIRAVHSVSGIMRIRLGSLEPGIITEEFARELAAMTKFCPHFHLSLQSGCDATLKRMNRRYSSQEYYEKCRILRDHFDNPALTTDVIVGFPGETEEEFRQSFAFVEKIRFYETHIFKYSKRAGTKAAEMPDQIEESVKAKRSAVMLELNERRRREYESAFIGKEVEVLVEEESLIGGRTVQTGHTKEYINIALDVEENMRNCIVNIQIENDSQIIH